MPQKGLVGNRAVVERNYAILPPEGIPESVLPEWTGTAARVLTAPAMGARFVEYRLDLAAGGGSKQTLQDRKSTRLNSRHLVISDAGFCFKKKKKQHAT